MTLSNNSVRILDGTVDPSAGGGVPAPEGSIYQRYQISSGKLYIKVGTADTAWQQLTATSESSLAGSGTANKLAFFTSATILNDTGSIPATTGLFWDNINDRLGINVPTGSLTESLHINGNIAGNGAGAHSIFADTGANNITLGGGTSTVLIPGNLTIQGTTTSIETTNLTVEDKLITLNKNGLTDSAYNSGIELEENLLVTGYIKTNGTGATDTNAWRFKTPTIASEFTLSFIDLTNHRVYTIPDNNGTFVYYPNNDTTNLAAGSGISSLISSSNNTIFGNDAGQNLSINGGNTFIGNSSGINEAGSDNTAIGYLSLGSSTLSSGNSALGINSGNNLSTGSYGVYLGRFSGVTTGTEDHSIAIGNYATVTANNQLVIGSEISPILEAYIGQGVTTGTPSSLTLQTSGGFGTNIAGQNLIIAGGKGTGTGSGGYLSFRTAPPGGSGSSLNSLREAMRIKDDSSISMGVGVPTSFTITGGSTYNSILATSEDRSIIANTEAYLGFAYDNTADVASNIMLLRARGSQASPTVISSNDLLGSINGLGYYATGTSYSRAGSIEFRANAAPDGSGYIPGRIDFLVTNTGAGTTTRRAAITENGLGVGVLPSARVHIQDTTGGNQLLKIEGPAGALNNTNRIYRQYVVNTTNNSATTLASIATTSNTVYLVEARVIGVRTGGSSGSTGDSATYVRHTRFKNIAGVLSIEAVNATFTDEDQGSWNCTLVVSGTNIIVRVVGANNNNIEWQGTIAVQSVQYA